MHAGEKSAPLIPAGCDASRWRPSEHQEVSCAKPDPSASNFAADINANSLEVLPDAKLEPALAGGNAPEAVQFERQGYFVRDPDSTPGKPVFTRTVGLRDTWAKVSGG